jgi:alkylation response protein AidB-like acyl-CoA dehydrogenase
MSNTVDAVHLDDAIEQIRRRARDVDSGRIFPRESCDLLGRSGALGLVVPSSAGGSDGGLSELVDACELIGGACASTGMVFLMHSVAAATLAAGGGPTAERYLPAMARGELLGTLAFSERGTGAHFYAPELSAARANGGVRISGRKSFITSAGEAGVYLVLVQGEAPDTLDCYAVERSDAVRFEGDWLGIGMAGNGSIAMELDVQIDDEQRVGDPGAGRDLVFSAVAPFFLSGLAAVNTGIGAAALNAAIEHVKTRRYPDGTSLAELPFVQHTLADMDLRLRGARLLVAEAARLGDSGDDEALVAIMEAKVAATEAAAEVARRALELCGGQGYTSVLPVERHLRDALAGAVMAPTNAVLKTWAGKALAGLPVP